MPSTSLDPLTTYRQKQADTALLNACRSFTQGSFTLAEVRQALDDGAEPNVRATTVDHGKGARPLHLAAKHGAARAVIELLIERGARLNTLLPDGSTPLHLAARHGHVEALEALLDAGASTDARTKNGLTPLGMALLVKPLGKTAGGVLPTVHALLARGVSLNDLNEGALHPLHEAARQLNLGVLTLLLERGVSPNLRDARGQLALGVLRGAVAFQQRWFTGEDLDGAALAVVNRLLEAGADVNVAVSMDAGETALSYLLQAEHVPQVVVQRLLDAGASPQGTAKRAMGLLAARGDVDTLTTLLRGGIDPNQVDARQETLLHHTVRSGSNEALARLHAVQRLLLDHGADPNRLDQDGFSPLHRALTMESTALSMAHVGVLLNHGADPNVVMARHVAPLTIAGKPDEVSDRFGFNRNKRGPLIDLLLAHGADPFRATMNNVPLPFGDLVSPVFRERIQAHIEAHPPTQERFVEALQQAWIRERPERVRVMLDLWLSDAFKLGVEPELILGTYRAQAHQVLGERRRVLDTMVPVLEARIFQQAANAVPMTAVERPRSRL